MSNLRALLVALTIIAMVIAPVLVSFVGVGSSQGLSAFAAALAAPGMQDDDDDGNDDEDGNGDGDDGNNDGVDGDDDDGNGDDDGGGNDDDGDDNDNGGNDSDDGDDDGGGGDDGDDDDGPASPFVPGYTPPARTQSAQADCSTPGRESVFTSSDGTVSVRVYGTMPQGVRIVIRKPVDAGSVPAVPGQQVDALLFEITAQTCDGQSLARLPGEANLGIRYTDGDVGGLNEASFKVARVDSGAWKDVEKQAPDPGANYVSATIMDLGYYVVHVP